MFLELSDLCSYAWIKREFCVLLVCSVSSLNCDSSHTLVESELLLLLVAYTDVLFALLETSCSNLANNLPIVPNV